MESEGADKPKTLPRSWAFHPAGELHSEIFSEYLGRKIQAHELGKELFKATKKQFITAGESPLSHLRWRHRDLLLLCLEIIGDLEYELNQGHPYFTGSPDHDENDNDDAPYIPKIKEPSCTRLELEESAADWYLKTKRETNFQMPIAEIHRDDCELPTSVQYYRWERNNQNRTAEEFTHLEANQKPRGEAAKPQCNEQLSWEDLEGDDLDNKGVCSLILEWLLESGNPAGKCLDSINDALKEAQRHASRKLRNDKKEHPVRLRIHSEDFLFHRFAMIDPGSRGGKSSTYKRIIRSKWEI